MDAEPLSDLPGRVEFEVEATCTSPLVAVVLVVSRFIIGPFNAGPVSVPGVDRPEPHGGEAGVFLEAAGVRACEDHGEGFLRDSGPDLLQVFLEHDDLAARFLHAG